MVIVVFILDWLIALLTIFCPGLTMRSMILIIFSGNAHFTMLANNLLFLTDLLVIYNPIFLKLKPAMSAVLKLDAVVFFFMFFFRIFIDRHLTSLTFNDVTQTVSQMKLVFLFWQLFLTVMAMLHYQILLTLYIINSKIY